MKLSERLATIASTPKMPVAVDRHGLVFLRDPVMRVRKRDDGFWEYQLPGDRWRHQLHSRETAIRFGISDMISREAGEL